MRVTLLAAQTQRIHPLGRYGGGHSASHCAHHALKVEKLRLLHVIDPALDMSLRRHETVSELHRMAGQKGDDIIVLVQRVVPVVRMAGQERTDEAGPLPYPTTVLLEIEGNPRRMIMAHTDTVDDSDSPTERCSASHFSRQSQSSGLDVAEFRHQRNLTDLDVREFGRHRKET